MFHFKKRASNIFVFHDRKNLQIDPFAPLFARLYFLKSGTMEHYFKINDLAWNIIGTIPFITEHYFIINDLAPPLYF
jgi:hypothetical protein